MNDDNSNTGTTMLITKREKHSAMRRNQSIFLPERLLRTWYRYIYINKLLQIVFRLTFGWNQMFDDLSELSKVFLLRIKSSMFAIPILNMILILKEIKVGTVSNGDTVPAVSCIIYPRNKWHTQQRRNSFAFTLLCFSR